MKIELHLHTARYSSCAVSTPHELMNALLAGGYQAVFITEHDAVWADWELDNLRKEFPAIRIFPGMELSFGETSREHLLILGSNDRAYLGLQPGEAVARARHHGHMSVLAHPFRWSGGDAMLKVGMLPDAIEYRTCNQDAASAVIASQRASQLGLPLVNAGDIHSVDMLNRYWIDTSRDVDNPSDIRNIITGSQYVNQTA